jgi:hypothetical protein
MEQNPIQFTSRTFNTIMADINTRAALADTPNWWKTMIAGIGDVFSVWENFSANQSMLRTALTRRAVADICQMLDYAMSERVSASGLVLFDVNASPGFPETLSASVLTALTSAGARYEARAPLTVSILYALASPSGWNVATGEITISGGASTFVTGERVKITAGTLPGGILSASWYYVIVVNSTAIKLAESRTNAYAGVNIYFTTSGVGTIQIYHYSAQATLYQQTTAATASIGTSDGTTEAQAFQIPRIGVQPATLTITINSVVWTMVDTFVYSTPTDTHYRLTYNTDGTAVVTFGDGVYGAIPGAFDIIAAYAYGGGSAGNITASNGISVYVGGDSRIVGCSNSSAITGGADAETIPHAKRLAPLLLKARDRFVTMEDGASLVEAYGGVATAAVNVNTYGVLSCQVLGIANGGGNPSLALRTAIAAYLVSKSVLSSIDVHFDAATITTVAVTSAAKMASGYLWATVQPYFDLAWKLFLTEAGAEILGVYQDGGVGTAVTLINTIFSLSLAAADYVQVAKILDQYDKIAPRTFGETIQESDVAVFIQGGVYGIDYMTIAVPTFPLVMDPDEITTPGTLTLTEIP